MKFLIITLLALLSSQAHAQIDEVRSAKLSDVLQHVKSEHDINERLAKPFDAIAQSFHGTRAEVLTFFKAEAPHMTEESNAAWSSLLNEASGRHAKNASETYQSLIVADAVGSFIKAKSSHAVKNLPFNEIELVKVLKELNTNQKELFASTLKRTAEIANHSNVPTLKDAFEQALKERGEFADYEKGCKK